MKKRTLFIGDIHGCFDELLLLLKKVNYKPGFDRLLFVGDLINKGPFSLEVIEYCYKNNLEVVKGNHEYNFLDRIDKKILKNNEIYDKIINSSVDYLTWIRSMPLFIEEKNFLLVHAGLKPNTHPSKTDPEILTKVRNWEEGKILKPWYEFYNDKKIIVYGHWAAQGLMIRNNTKGLDSGCCYGRQLSCYILEENLVIQVDALKEYFQVSY